MREKARPLMDIGIDELIDMAEDASERDAVRCELAFRKTRKAVKLATILGCVTKRRLSNREAMAQWDSVDAGIEHVQRGLDRVGMLTGGIIEAGSAGEVL